ncbi:hypothetical protein A1O7_00724 [Cladophialophora yegresii CBS 114405]|uniref:Arb2 domain-containing protein n=1 Tax=Cladophialophora yegresii CBS 114405 TaxID=1182544 RepID=W9W8X9_9EURO|nr:uncharacterized protein A1O7_00724 [Cladophialophora yegresii CBS 114405]EXJ64388.1 hypothetical protein A1O7_00724 [Cladophialophora yegresii CBS 114405]
MFRRKADTLPADPVFEPDLDKLGFFINDQDQVRSIKNLERKYQYQINRNERWNQVHKAAVCNIVQQRLLDLGFERVRLPLGAAEQENHVPILVSKGIATKDRVIVIFGGRNEEPGILSWRVIGEEGIRHGSLVEFATAVLSTPAAASTVASTPTENGVTNDTIITSTATTPGIIVANPCQLLWYRGGSRAVSNYEWLCLPRPSAVHDAPRVDPVKNRIPGNHDYIEHVQYIFQNVIPSLVNERARIDIIGVEFTGTAVVEYLAEYWNVWSPRITGIALVTPQHKLADLEAQGAPSTFVEFLSKRCRAYFVSQSQIEKPIAGREQFGCNCYASGERHVEESALVRSWRHILDWSDMLHVNPGYEEVEYEVVERDEDIKLGWD